MNISEKKTIDIMLTSHTNVGKTALIRTLLGEDVGEVRDAPDVTTVVTRYDLFVGQSDEALYLWDTPGFVDSFRLAKRLKQKYRLVAWIVREIWDRYRNPRLFRGQRVVLNVKERADVILYLVNSERPVDAVYFKPELEILSWTGKPVLAILNQSGEPQLPESESSSMREWRDALAAKPVIKTLALDSLTRCWVQEFVLYDEIGDALQPPLKEIYVRLAKSIKEEHRKRFDTSIKAIAAYLLNMAADKVELDTDRIERFKIFIREKLHWGNSEPYEDASKELVRHFWDGTNTVTDKLIKINRLTGVSSEEIIKFAGKKFSVDKPIDETQSALSGGIISGFFAGLAADLATGGLTLGTGALVGAVLGAIGAATLARGYNIYTNKDKTVVSWNFESLNEAFTESVRLYLAIAHFGRGRGQWERQEAPEYRSKVVNDSISRCRDRLLELWKSVRKEENSPQRDHECADLQRDVLLDILNELYPGTRRQIGAAGD